MADGYRRMSVVFDQGQTVHSISDLVLYMNGGEIEMPQGLRLDIGMVLFLR
jgi:hypothetical protein